MRSRIVGGPLVQLAQKMPRLTIWNLARWCTRRKTTQSVNVIFEPRNVVSRDTTTIDVVTKAFDARVGERFLSFEKDRPSKVMAG